MRKKYVAKIDHPRYEAVGRELAALVPDSFPFWLGTIAAHPKPVGKAKSANMEAIVSNGVPHVHLIIGGISYTRIRTILGAWPGIKKWRKVSTPWNWLHYLLSQELKDDHRRDLFSHCHNLLQPPIESWNLEAVLIAHRYRLRIKRRRPPQEPEEVVSRWRPSRGQGSTDRRSPRDARRRGHRYRASRVAARSRWRLRRLGSPPTVATWSLAPD
jgi:hypothetical protein